MEKYVLLAEERFAEAGRSVSGEARVIKRKLDALNSDPNRSIGNFSSTLGGQSCERCRHNIQLALNKHHLKRDGWITGTQILCEDCHREEHQLERRF